MPRDRAFAANAARGSVAARDSAAGIASRICRSAAFLASSNVRVVPINRRAGYPRHDAGRSPCCRPFRCVCRRCRARLLPIAATFALGAHAQSVPPPAVLDPVVVTASRSPQRLLDLVADVTVIDARRDRAWRRAGRRRAAAAPARRRDRPERRAGRDGRRVPARRERRADARADRRHARRFGVERRDGAGGDSARADRADRDPARAGVEPLRRRCDRRRHPGLHAARRRRRARQCVGRLRHVRHRRRDRRASRGGSDARARQRARSPDAAATASTRSSIRPISATTPIATAIATRASARNGALAGSRRTTRCRCSTSAAVSTTSSTAATRSTTGRSRRSPRGGRRSTIVSHPNWHSMLSAGDGSDRSVSKTGVRRVSVRDAPASVHVAERLHAAAPAR